MFRKSYVRGVNKALVDTRAVKYANEEQAVQVADAVAEALPEQPVNEVAPEDTAEIATTLVELSNKLEEASSAAAGAAEAVAGEQAAESPMAVEESALKSAAAFLRRKIATNPTGSTITGDKPNQQNTEPLSENAEAKMDLADRPEAYANVGEFGVGTQEASGAGAVGNEEVHQGVGMGPVGEDGANSATEATTKAATLRQLVKKVAMGTTITGTDPAQQNTQGQAAQVSGEGALEAKNRPEGYAVKGEAGVGQSDLAAEESASAVGTEHPHPGTMGPVGSDGTNSAIQQIPGKTAEENEWLRRFKTASAKYAPVLPFWMSEHEKVASIQYFMGLSPSEAQSVASHIQKTAEIPEALKAYVEKKKDDSEKKDEKKDGEKKDGEKKDDSECKEASLRAGDIVAKLRSLNA